MTGTPDRRRGAVFALAVFLLFGCAPSGPVTRPPSGMPAPPTVPALPDQVDADGRAWVDGMLATLSLEAAVGQLIFPWISGSYAAEDDPEFLEALEWVERWGIGGVAISIGTPHAYAAKLNALQLRSALPLLVTSDFENGGPGMRINHAYALPSLLPQGGGTSFPPTMAFGAIGEEEEVERFARITAQEARAVGVHVNFSPVLDVNSNPENPIINTRAFGESPEEVARLGRAYIRGARAGGVLSTAKHFPGHGDTRVDSHLTLPEVTADRSRLDAVELIPFAAAIEEGVDAVMTAHVSVPGILGPDAPPATLSPEFMTEILREDLGFDGLLFTDALRMGAITEGYGAGEAAVLALEAGADVILIPESVPAAAAAVMEAVRSGRLDRARIDESVRRILESKARIGLHVERTVPVESVARVVGIAEHRAAAERVSARSMTLTRDEGSIVPLDPERVRRVLSVTYAAPEDLPAGREFDAVLAGLLPEVEGIRVGPGSSAEDLDAVMERARTADVVLMNAYVPPRAGAGSVALPEGIQDFIGDMIQRHPTVLISFGNPYLLNAVPAVGTYLIAWGDREISQGAAARAIAGAAPIGGRLPITLPGIHARGTGLDRAAIPAVAARVGARRDALDEAGLVRGGGAEPPPDTVPLPADSLDAAAPGAWQGLRISPLEADPATVAMAPDQLEALDAYILRALEDSVAPGAALAVARGGRLVRLRGYGRLDWDAASPEVTPFSLYDLASLTKVVGTTPAVMLLVDEGRLRLDDPVTRYLPEFSRGDPRKDRVTVRHLLLHESGLPAFRAFFPEFTGKEAVREAVFDLRLTSEPGAATVYSDIGFMTLAWIVEAVSGEPYEAFLTSRIFDTLGMTDTGFLPDPEDLRRIAPTERESTGRPYPLVGEVHDENAHAMGGVAGHAGLFGSVQDLAVYAQALLARGLAGPCGFEPGSGVPCGAHGLDREMRLFSQATVESFTTPPNGSGSRALGWDTPSGRSSAGDYFSERSFGHTGFTGTSIWIDPELDLVVVLLTNRVNPTRANERHIPFRRAVHDGVVAAIADREVELREGSEGDP